MPPLNSTSAAAIAASSSTSSRSEDSAMISSTTRRGGGGAGRRSSEGDKHAIEPQRRGSADLNVSVGPSRPPGRHQRSRTATTLFSTKLSRFGALSPPSSPSRRGGYESRRHQYASTAEEQRESFGTLDRLHSHPPPSLTPSSSSTLLPFADGDTTAAAVASNAITPRLGSLTHETVFERGGTRERLMSCPAPVSAAVTRMNRRHYTGAAHARHDSLDEFLIMNDNIREGIDDADSIVEIDTHATMTTSAAAGMTQQSISVPHPYYYDSASNRSFQRLRPYPSSSFDEDDDGDGRNNIHYDKNKNNDRDDENFSIDSRDSRTSWLSWESLRGRMTKIAETTATTTNSSSSVRLTGRRRFRLGSRDVIRSRLGSANGSGAVIVGGRRNRLGSRDTVGAARRKSSTGRDGVVAVDAAPKRSRLSSIGNRKTSTANNSSSSSAFTAASAATTTTKNSPGRKGIRKKFQQQQQQKEGKKQHRLELEEVSPVPYVDCDSDADDEREGSDTFGTPQSSPILLPMEPPSTTTTTAAVATDSVKHGNAFQLAMSDMNLPPPLPPQRERLASDESVYDVPLDSTPPPSPPRERILLGSKSLAVFVDNEGGQQQRTFQRVHSESPSRGGGNRNGGLYSFLSSHLTTTLGSQSSNEKEEEGQDRFVQDNTGSLSDTVTPTTTRAEGLLGAGSGSSESTVASSLSTASTTIASPGSTPDMAGRTMTATTSTAPTTMRGGTLSFRQQAQPPPQPSPLQQQQQPSFIRQSSLNILNTPMGGSRILDDTINAGMDARLTTPDRQFVEAVRKSSVESISTPIRYDNYPSPILPLPPPPPPQPPSSAPSFDHDADYSHGYSHLYGKQHVDDTLTYDGDDDDDADYGSCSDGSGSSSSGSSSIDESIFHDSVCSTEEMEERYKRNLERQEREKVALMIQKPKPMKPHVISKRPRTRSGRASAISAGGKTQQQFRSREEFSRRFPAIEEDKIEMEETKKSGEGVGEKQQKQHQRFPSFSWLAESDVASIDHGSVTERIEADSEEDDNVSTTVVVEDNGKNVKTEQRQKKNHRRRETSASFLTPPSSAAERRSVVSARTNQEGGYGGKSERRVSRRLSSPFRFGSGSIYRKAKSSYPHFPATIPEGSSNMAEDTVRNDRGEERQEAKSISHRRHTYTTPIVAPPELRTNSFSKSTFGKVGESLLPGVGVGLLRGHKKAASSQPSIPEDSVYEEPNEVVKVDEEEYEYAGDDYDYVHPAKSGARSAVHGTSARDDKTPARRQNFYEGHKKSRSLNLPVTDGDQNQQFQRQPSWKRNKSDGISRTVSFQDMDANQHKIHASLPAHAHGTAPSSVRQNTLLEGKEEGKEPSMEEEYEYKEGDFDYADRLTNSAVRPISRTTKTESTIDTNGEKRSKHGKSLSFPGVFSRERHKKKHYRSKTANNDGTRSVGDEEASSVMSTASQRSWKSRHKKLPSLPFIARFHSHRDSSADAAATSPARYHMPPTSAELDRMLADENAYRRGRSHERAPSMPAYMHAAGDSPNRSRIDGRRSRMYRSARRSVLYDENGELILRPGDDTSSHRKIVSAMPTLENPGSEAESEETDRERELSPFGARSRLIRQLDSEKTARRRVGRIRPELLEDDFEDYFDEIYSFFRDEEDGPKEGEERQISPTTRKKSVLWNDSVSNFLACIGSGAVPAENVVVNGDRRSVLRKQKKASQNQKTAVKMRLRRREEAAVAVLRGKHGFTTGLARLCHRLAMYQLPLHIWIIDNSGSMATGDGRRFLDGTRKAAAAASLSKNSSKSKMGYVSQMVNCNRWEELRDAVLFHAELAADLGAPTLFRLMNDPNIALAEWRREMNEPEEDVEVLPQVIGVCARRVEPLQKDKTATGTSRVSSPTSGLVRLLPFSVRRNMNEENEDEDNDQESPPWEGVWEVDRGAADAIDAHWMDRAQKDLELVRHVFYETEPRYTTPLSCPLWAIHEQVKSMESYLRQGQRVAVIIATDGLPDNPALFLDAMQSIQKLPIFLIVRLCTDDEAAMHFWKTLDLDLKLPVEILDDFEAEANLAYTMNPWLNYCMPLQRIREWGYKTQLLDHLLDRPLTHAELREFCALIFGVKLSNLPDPLEEWEDFYYDIESLVSRESRQWNPLMKRTKGWIDVKKMAEIYGGKAERHRQQRLKKLRKLRQKEEKAKRKVKIEKIKARQQREKATNGLDEKESKRKRLLLRLARKR